MKSLKFLGLSLSRSEMRNVKAGGMYMSLSTADAPCGQSNCQSDSDCKGSCNRPGINQRCALIACERNGSNSSYQHCSC